MMIENRDAQHQTSDSLVSLQSVFRLAVPTDQSTKRSRSSIAANTDLPIRPRRTHNKSRGGCLACKKRRTKVRKYHFHLDQMVITIAIISVMSKNLNVANALDHYLEQHASTVRLLLQYREAMSRSGGLSFHPPAVCTACLWRLRRVVWVSTCDCPCGTRYTRLHPT